MAISLSQKLSSKFTFRHRLLAAYGITDEIFAVCAAKDGEVAPLFMYGVILISTFGWVLGTFLGAFSGELLPPSVTAALGIMLYGMFTAIIIPPARKYKSILFVVIIAAALSMVCKYLIKSLSGGLSVIICAIIAAALAAVIFPKEDEE